MRTKLRDFLFLNFGPSGCLFVIGVRYSAGSSRVGKR